MYHYRHSEESRPVVSITSSIVEGKPWVARSISNNNLRQHCHVLARTFRGDHPLTDPIRAPCSRLLIAVAGKTDLLTAIHPSDFPLVPVIVRIAAYANRWLRQPESWGGEESESPREVLKSLLQHLFAAWKMPECFHSAWLVKGDLTYLERDWYCHLAGGGSLRHVQGMPPSITTRALHLATEAPGNLTIRQALRWGQVKALGGGHELLAEVLTSRMVKDLSNDAIWSRLLEKVVAAEDFKTRHFGIIVDTLLEVIRKDPQRAETLVGLPFGELLRHSWSFWASMLRLTHVETPEWKRSDITCPHVRWELHCRNTEQWARLPGSKPFDSLCHYEGETLQCRIQELTHQWQLVAESQAMKHCVDTYGRSCKTGRCSIFSVRSDQMIEGKSVTTTHLTIEVDRRSRRILQVRGRRNQYFAPSRIHLLCKWANELQLTM